MELLSLTPEEVGALTPDRRAERLGLLIEDSRRILAEATEEHFAKHSIAGVVVLFSGGNDSTTLLHLMRRYFRVDAAAHANTGIGIEETREFVRSTCAAWDIPLVEKHPPAGSTYRELVLDQAFPGPGHHYKMFQRLKERPLRQVRAEFVKNPRRERVIFVAGRRRQESKRRQSIPEHERIDATVWVSPIANWHKLDLATYRTLHPDVPRNLVSDTLHMSGECLCGAFAHAGELDEIAFWFPKVAQEIRDLEAEVRATGRHPEKKCRWGWGGESDEKPSESGPLCQSCDARFEVTT